MCYVPRGMKGQAQLLSLTEIKSHLLPLILLAEALTDEEDNSTHFVNSR